MEVPHDVSYLSTWHIYRVTDLAGFRVALHRRPEHGLRLAADDDRPAAGQRRSAVDVVVDVVPQRSRDASRG